MDRMMFFDAVRHSLFGGTMMQSQTDGLHALLDYADVRAPTIDPRHIAYILATAYHETAMTMQPTADYDKGAGQAYGTPDAETGQTYYGRGYVRLTSKEHYAAQEAKSGFPLVEQPDVLMQPRQAAQILYEGMLAGEFTGVALREHIHGSACDYVNARRVVNETDRADEIARYAEQFQEAITHAMRYVPSAHDLPVQPSTDPLRYVPSPHDPRA